MLRAAGAKVIVPARDRDRAATALKGIDVELQLIDPEAAECLWSLSEQLLGQEGNPSA